jgi:hypothetical protein
VLNRSGEVIDGEALPLRAPRPRRWLADLVARPAPPDELQRRLAEVEAAERRLVARERELLRREAAAARWFGELSRTQQVLEQRERRLDPGDG